MRPFGRHLSGYYREVWRAPRSLTELRDRIRTTTPTPYNHWMGITWSDVRGPINTLNAALKDRR